MGITRHELSRDQSMVRALNRIADATERIANCLEERTYGVTREQLDFAKRQLADDMEAKADE